MTKTLLRTALILLTLQLLVGCAAVVVGGAAATGLAVQDRRSFGTVVDDNVLEIRVGDALYGDEAFDTSSRIRIVAYDGWVLLAGEVLDQRRVERATELVRQVDGVVRLFNELTPQAKASLGRRNSDRWISTRVKTSLAAIDLPDFNATRVKVMTTRGVVYLMGLVSREEAEAATEQARVVRGVERVVTMFQYLEELPETEVLD
ncbi:BON domain-containing protein [Wenzhouxiangella marina]|uniref:Transport-associated protein n=1 Tax=Wenzhouxiangella marina TaxID=1579979 RepID=A0A0K0XY17_9GAMM|nr:BON domain-containing protein [Wenzhouxiangella marina]AKS42594.1 Transport-associated protein [Wenzhouxiangella marina]MBB6085624.1 osmotically-inducible protein OsmY [Wenzhouxiangella marina]